MEKKLKKLCVSVPLWLNISRRSVMLDITYAGHIGTGGEKNLDVILEK
ncbi:MAG TPA: hypothetical protein VF131_12820 [Blastocatellia bacterium]|nr:hypothetical protein [Blastocatellia bacterium]